MVFMTSLADFGTPMLIGEGYKVLPVLVYEEFMSEIGGNVSMASTLSVIIVLCSLTVLFIQKKIIAKKNYTMSALRPPKVKELTLGKRILATVFCFLVALIAMSQQIVVIVTSFLKTSGPLFLKEFSLESYRLVRHRLSHNISNTLRFPLLPLLL